MWFYTGDINGDGARDFEGADPIRRGEILLLADEKCKIKMG